MNKENLIKEVQRVIGYLVQDKEIKAVMVELVKSGMTPTQVANHVREIVIRYSLMTDNY